MDALLERVVTSLLRSTAGAMLSAGVAIFIAAAPVYGFVTDASLLQAGGAILLQIGGALLAAGIVARMLLRQRGHLPNERVHQPASFSGNGLRRLLVCCELMAAVGERA
jgi:hypothetical protein